MSRKFCVGGNWKMNGDMRMIVAIIDRMLKNDIASMTETEVVIGCPAIYLQHVRKLLPKTVGVAAQNCYSKAAGA